LIINEEIVQDAARLVRSRVRWGEEERGGVEESEDGA